MLARRVGQQTAAIRACRYASQVSPRAAAEQHPHLHHVLGDQVLTMRTMDYITSPLDALAIVRAVERRFGRVAEYRFYRVGFVLCYRPKMQVTRSVGRRDFKQVPVRRSFCVLGPRFVCPRAQKKQHENSRKSAAPNN